MTTHFAQNAARRPWLLVVSLAIIAALIGSLLVSTAQTDAQAPDYDLPVAFGAHFYTQTNGGIAGTGYAVSNADGIPFWNFFQQVGGVQAVGYPVSHRFVWNGFTVQAMQKVVFQWRPEANTVYYLNILDLMHDDGLDPYLQNVRQVPPIADWSGDTGLPFDQVQQRHLALLNANQAIANAFYSSSDWLNQNGLPMAPIQDMGGVLVLRAQRKVYQQWLTDRPWAAAGQVVTANGGDLGKELGVYPQAAVIPQPASTVPLSAVTGPPPTPLGPPNPTATPTPMPNCNGDERMSFNPPNPQVGQTVNIAVNSARASSNIALNGPLNPSYVGVKPVSGGYEWDWLVVPTQPGSYTYNFTINGQVCTSNFVVVGGSAATATPTNTPQAQPTNTPVPTNTPPPANQCAGVGFAVTPSQPLAGEQFTIRVTAPAATNPRLEGQGLLSNTPSNNTSPFEFTASLGSPGSYEYTFSAGGQTCQSTQVRVEPR